MQEMENLFSSNLLLFVFPSLGCLIHFILKNCVCVCIRYAVILVLTITIYHIYHNYHIYLIIYHIYHIFRYGKLLFPTHSRPTAGLLLPLVWVVSLLLVLPYTSHIRHEHLATGHVYHIYHKPS